MDNYLPSTVPSCIRNAYEFWCILVVREDTTKLLARQLIRKAPNKVIHCFAEVAKNLLIGNVSLSKSDIEGLRKYRRLLTDLANAKVKLEAKRCKLVKYADQLPIIFAPIAHLIENECKQFNGNKCTEAVGGT